MKYIVVDKYGNQRGRVFYDKKSALAFIGMHNRWDWNIIEL